MDPAHPSGCVAVHLTALGVGFLIRASGSEAQRFADDVRSAWAWCLGDDDVTPGGAEVVDVLVGEDGAAVAAARARGVLAGTGRGEVLHQLSPAITLRAIRRRAGSLLMVHACALAEPASGLTVALVGPSGAGKTTAARALAGQLRYVTDETVALQDDDTVLPYPKPLSILGARGQLKVQVPPASLGLERPPEVCRLAKLLVLDRRADGPRTPVREPIGTLLALAELSPHISFLARRPRPLHRLASTLVATGGLERVRYREAVDLTEVVSAVIEESG